MMMQKKKKASNVIHLLSLMYIFLYFWMHCNTVSNCMLSCKPEGADIRRFQRRRQDFGNAWLQHAKSRASSCLRVTAAKMVAARCSWERHEGLVGQCCWCRWCKLKPCGWSGGASLLLKMLLSDGSLYDVLLNGFKDLGFNNKNYVSVGGCPPVCPVCILLSRAALRLTMYSQETDGTTHWSAQGLLDCWSNVYMVMISFHCWSGDARLFGVVTYTSVCPWCE